MQSDKLEIKAKFLVEKQKAELIISQIQVNLEKAKASAKSKIYEEDQYYETLNKTWNRDQVDNVDNGKLILRNIKEEKKKKS